MAEMRAVHFERGGKQTQYMLMLRAGDVWKVFQGIWAEHDDEARSKGAALVAELESRDGRYRNSVFVVSKVLSTNGAADL